MQMPESAVIEKRFKPIDRVLDRLGIDRPTGAVFGLVIVGVIARLFALGGRLAHFDEGRVGYWVLHFMETGEFHYRYIIHGPLLQHVNSVVFSVFGANDFTLRVIVALIGAFLPISVLLLREHLRGPEIVGAAAFLTFNPVLLYYSRFFRSTIPVAAFSFAAFACFVRFYDTRRVRYMHGGVILFALGFTAKENAAIYLLVFLGAGALLLDTELFRPRTSTTGTAWLTRKWRRMVRDRDLQTVLPRVLGHLALAIGLFILIILFFYAPRSGTSNGVGLYTALGDPGQLPAVVDATISDIQIGFEYWFGGAAETGSEVSLPDQYRNFLERTVSLLSTYAAPLIAFAGIGALAERYASSHPRNLVQFTTYWGVVSVVGYPLGADIFGAWIAVNMLVPLAIPAGVGVAILYRWGREAYLNEDELSLGIVGLLSIFVIAQVVGTGVGAVYANPTADENGLVQYAQPGDADLRETLKDIDRLATTQATKAKPTPTVLFFGESLANPADEPIEPACANIGKTLPLQWYLTRSDIEADCVRYGTEFDFEYRDTAPSVIITTPNRADTVQERVPNYERREHLMRTSIERLVFFLDTDS